MPTRRPIAIVALFSAAAAPASATSPGRNGRIFFSARPALRSISGCGVASVRTNGTGWNCVDFVGRDPAISPDNKRIVSVRGDERVEVYASDINGKGVKRLTRAPGTFPNSLSPSFSPDSRRILWFKYGGEEGTGGLYVMNADGSGQRQLTGDGGQDPVFSPKGSLIAYDVRGVAVANADGSGSHLIAPDKNQTTASPPGKYTEGNGEPTWGPDGRRLAFSRRTITSSLICNPAPPACSGVKNERAADVYVMNADGSGLRQLTSTPKVDEVDPSWSPDGQMIAYFRKPEGADDFDGEIWVMRADGSGQKRVALGANPEWSSLQGGPKKPVLILQTRRINRRRSCLGGLDGVVARVKTTASRDTLFNVHFFVDGRRLDDEYNSRGFGVGIDQVFPRRKVHRFKVIVDGPGVGDRIIRTLRVRRC